MALTVSIECVSAQILTQSRYGIIAASLCSPPTLLAFADEVLEFCAIGSLADQILELT